MKSTSGETLLSDVAANEIARRRRGAGLTHRQLAARCKKHGWPALTASAISDIETGRRDGAGRRRREIKVDELAVLARALDVAPVLLLAPLGYTDQVGVLPSESVSALRAYEWLTGQATQVGGHDGTPARWQQQDQAITVYKEYRRAELAFLEAQLKGDEQARRRAWVLVEALQRSISSFEWKIPPLVPDPGESTEETS